MKPGKLDLPTIWRGCDWGPVTLKWKDQNGDPIDLSSWRPKAQSLNFDLNPVVSDPENGVTILALGKEQTATFGLGIEAWDWIWETDSGVYRYPPFLSGKIQIKDPVSSLNGDEGPPLPPPPAIPDAGNATDVTGTSFRANWTGVSGAGGYQLDVSRVSDFTTYVAGYRRLNVGFVIDYAVTGLLPDTTYYYRVRSFNIGGASLSSNVIDVHTTPPPPPPANDDFNISTNPTLAGLNGTISGTTISATRQTGEPAGDNSVWYKWTPGTGIVAYLSLDNNTNRISVYRGTAFNNFVHVAESQSNNALSFLPESGTAYRIRVYKKTGVGPFVLTWSYSI